MKKPIVTCSWEPTFRETCSQWLPSKKLNISPYRITTVHFIKDATTTFIHGINLRIIYIHSKRASRSLFNVTLFFLNDVSSICVYFLRSHHRFHFRRLLSSPPPKMRHTSMASPPHVYVPQQPGENGGDRSFVSAVLRRVHARGRGGRQDEEIGDL